MDADTLAWRLERYYDGVPRTAARAQECGPFTLFVGTGAWGYYARPRLRDRSQQAAAITERDVRALRARQRAGRLPEQVEWQPAITPSLGSACEQAGMAVHTFPLMVLPGSAVVSPGPHASVRMLEPEDDVVPALAAQQQGFGAGGAVDPGLVEFLRTRLAAGHTVAAVAEVDGLTVAVGMHQPLDGVTEIVGVATLPAHRRQGWGAAVTAALVGDARARGVETVFLSAGDESVARIYRRVGFETVGAACAAEPAASP